MDKESEDFLHTLPPLSRPSCHFFDLWPLSISLVKKFNRRLSQAFEGYSLRLSSCDMPADFNKITR